MNGHFATPYLDDNGNWLNFKERYNITGCISPTAGQMARGLGIALASKKYRSNPQLQNTNFSDNGNEVAFLTIGDASTSEGIFWETMNAAAVMQVPLALSVWDDGYGISVPIDYQTVNKSISKALDGFKSELNSEGLDIYVIKGWDYPTLIEAYQTGIAKIRKTHKPALFHVREVTQPQGHSTSGSHERYKTKERLAWEAEYDGIKKMREWLLDSEIATEKELEEIEKEAEQEVKEAKKRAWKQFIDPVKTNIKTVQGILKQIITLTNHGEEIKPLITELSSLYNPTLREVIIIAKQALRILKDENTTPQGELEKWLEMTNREMAVVYQKHTYHESEKRGCSCQRNFSNL